MKRRNELFAATLIFVLASTFGGAAWATCSPAITSITDGISVDVSGCHLQVQNPPISTPTATTEFVIRDSATGEIASDGGSTSTTLTDHGTRLTTVEVKNVEQDSRLGSLETITSSHESRLTAHDAILSEHAATLASHSERLTTVEKGVAIAMAMPDLWLGEKEKFAIAGNFGGFNDETAIAAGMIARLDKTWSLNAAFGTDTEFKEFGWKVGARAGW